MDLFIEGINISIHQYLGFNDGILDDGTYHTTSTPNRPQPVDFMETIKRKINIVAYESASDTEKVASEWSNG